MATEPGPGVMRVQAAITNFDLTRPDPKLRDLLPAKIAINVTREVIGKEPICSGWAAWPSCSTPRAASCWCG